MTSPNPPPPPTAGSLPEGLSERLNRLCFRLQEIDPDRPDGLSALRHDLAALERVAHENGRQDLGPGLKRLALLTEVWECLAAERHESVHEAAAFCVRALGSVAAAAANECEAGDLSWILEESSASWHEYLGLLDPWSTSGIAGREQSSDTAMDIETDSDTEANTGFDSLAEAPPTAIDAATLFRMLTGADPPVPISKPKSPSSRSPAGGSEEGGGPKEGVRLEHRSGARPHQGGVPSDSSVGCSPHGADLTTTSIVGWGAGKDSPTEPLPSPSDGESKRNWSSPAPAYPTAASQEIDPEFREAFLAESLDLFERIESLVLSLNRGAGQESTLNELGRCFHTLKGAAGSVGLMELASRVHHLEQALEDAAGQITATLLDQLHEALSHLERVLDSLRQGSGSGPRPEGCARPRPAAVLGLDQPHSPPARPRISTAVDEEKPLRDEPPLQAEAADGPIRIPASRMDELMDLTSELIMRRGVWAAQAERMKEFAAMIRICRNDLQLRLESLNEMGLGRAVCGSSGARKAESRTNRAGIDESGGIATEVLRLAEQVEDLAVLTEAAQAQALPLADDSDTLARLTLQLWETLQSIRIVPIRGLFQRLARVAHDAARVEGREVGVVMIGEETGLDRAVQDKAFEPLLHIVRNAVGHGIEAPADRTRAGKAAVGRVTLEARREGNTLVVSVQDDGRGLDYAAIAEKGRRLGLLGPDEVAGPEQLSALIFRAGFSTREEANAISGRGVGMDVVAQEVRRLRATIDLTSQPGAGTRLTLRLPARLALEQATITRVAGQAFAIPVALIEHAQTFEPNDVERTGSRATVRVRDRQVPLIVARQALGFSATAQASCPKLLLVRAEGEALALLFDAIEGTRELVIKPLGPLLAGHPVIWGTSLSVTGDVIFILNPSGLFRWLCEGGAAAGPDHEPAPRPAPVLVVDDSISVRRVVSRQLRMLGLEVEEVSNGVEALGKLSSRPYSMVLTDLEMPRMDGFELLAELRRSPALAGLPVIVASTESRLATRRRALALGARAFVAKPIDQDELARVAGALLNRSIGGA